MKNLEEKAKAHALKNAIVHGGRAQVGAVIAGLFSEGLKKSEVKKYSKKISEIVRQVNSTLVEDQEKEFKKIKSKIHERKVREGLPELPNAKKGKVIMRFAPSASGPFHIAHATTAALSYLYVKKYGGIFYIRIEDTNPDNIYKPAYEMIKDESKWLFGNKAKIIIQSDRMEIYYKYAKKLVDKGAAYVCECPAENFRKSVAAKKDCACRKLGTKTHTKRWEKMLDAKGYNEGQAVLRFKSSMKDKNPAMRDFPLARINLSPHSLKGKKYRVWPLMNLAVAIDDIEMKMTHIIRGKDHRDNALRQQMIHKALGKKSPWVAFIGRIKFKDMELSTTKIKEAIKNKKYTGWDDPALPTIASLRKRGYKPEAFFKFAEQMGLSQADKVTDKREFLMLLDAFNKK